MSKIKYNENKRWKSNNIIFERENMQQIHRHGENVLQPITEIPKDAKLVETGKVVIVGHSESGHHHSLTVTKDKIKVYEKDGNLYLDVPETAQLEHQKTYEKHESQIIDPGFYERTVKRSFSYSEKMMKRVID